MLGEIEGRVQGTRAAYWVLTMAVCWGEAEGRLLGAVVGCLLDKAVSYWLGAAEGRSLAARTRAAYWVQSSAAC